MHSFNTRSCPIFLILIGANGNVIYVLDTTKGVGIGAGYCPYLTILDSDAGYDLHDTANFYFAGNHSGNLRRNNVIIGNKCGYVPKGKLDVLQASGNTTGSTGIYVENDDPASTAANPTIGLKCYLPAPPSYTVPTIAGFFEAGTPGINASTPHLNYSIVVPSETLPNFPGVVSIGYYPTPPPTYSQLLGSASPALVYVAGNISANGYYYVSDRKFKQDLLPLTHAIQKIDSIHPYYFYYDTTKYARFHFPGHEQVGFIAQNVDSVLPELVNPSDSGYSLDYPKMTALLLAGEQELIAKTDSIKTMMNQNNNLTQRVDSLSNALNNINQCIANLCHDTNRRGHRAQNQNDTNSSINVTLSNSAMLYQNAPNPFGSGGTKINYFLPQNTQGASIVFYDMYGNKLQSVPLTQTGMGSILVNPNQLSDGVYSYSLVINGNVFDTKKMVFQK